MISGSWGGSEKWFGFIFSPFAGGKWWRSTVCNYREKGSHPPWQCCAFAWIHNSPMLSVDSQSSRSNYLGFTSAALLFTLQIPDSLERHHCHQHQPSSSTIIWFDDLWLKYSILIWAKQTGAGVYVVKRSTWGHIKVFNLAAVLFDPSGFWKISWFFFRTFVMMMALVKRGVACGLTAAGVALPWHWLGSSHQRVRQRQSS